MFFFFLFLFFTSFQTIAGQSGHRRPPVRTWVTAGTAAVAPAPAPSPAQCTDPVAPTPTIWGMETPRCLAARKPPPPPTPLVPCKLLAPHLRHPSTPAPHPSSLASPHCCLCTAARKFAASTHPFMARKPHPVAARIRPPSLQGVQPPAVPATSSQHANTCCIHHPTLHRLVLVVSLLYILYYCNEYI